MRLIPQLRRVRSLNMARQASRGKSRTGWFWCIGAWYGIAGKERSVETRRAKAGRGRERNRRHCGFWRGGTRRGSASYGLAPQAVKGTQWIDSACWALVAQARRVTFWLVTARYSRLGES